MLWLNNTVCGLQEKTSMFEHVMFHSTKYHVAKFAFQLLAVLKPNPNEDTLESCH